MSVNVLVGIILGIIMFAAAIGIFFNLMSKSDKMSIIIDEETKANIEKALDSGDPIYVPATIIDSKKGSAQFWIGVRNIGSGTEKFKINVTEIGITANFDSTKIAYITKEYSINSKDNIFVPVVVNTKGVVQEIKLLVNVTKNSTQAGAPYLQYTKPKIVTINN